MKVLSIKEPFATLIKEKLKKIETRSWQTTYRGELYIHASLGDFEKDIKNRKELKKLVQTITPNQGYIICKCTLKDCIYMTEEYIEKIKQENYQEYICGDFRVGRYAWILTDIKPLSKRIKATGQLSIWSYYTPEETLTLMNNITSGYIDKFGNEHHQIDNNLNKNYTLSSPKQLQKNKIGLCFDQVELERYCLRSTGKIKTYLIIYKTPTICKTHTFLTLEQKNKILWIEHALSKYKGIHPYQNINLLLEDVCNKFINTILPSEYSKENLAIYEYKKPKSNITYKDFITHCTSSIPITIKKEK